MDRVTPTLEAHAEAVLKACPMCGSGPAVSAGRYTNASFSGVEVMDQLDRPYVWCGTCCVQTRTCDSIAEAVAVWNDRPAERAIYEAGARDMRERAAIGWDEPEWDDRAGDLTWKASQIEAAIRDLPLTAKEDGE